MAFDGIVFDLFHTLIDPDPLRPPGFNYRHSIADHLGLDRATFADYWEGTYEERETTTVDLADLVARHASSFGVEVAPGDRPMFDDWFGVAKDESLLSPPPELVDLVAQLSRSTAVGVLSNCYEREVRRWPDSPYAPLVSAFVGSCFLGVMKPDPKAYDAVLAELGVDAGRVIFVGNGGGSELEGADRHGFGAVIHMNAFDRLGTNVAAGEQQRRADLADESADAIEDLEVILRRRAPSWFA